MPAQVPTSEPSSITAGETLSWTRDESDYPATSWTLKYALQAPGRPVITITATADGSTHVVGVTADISSRYAPGSYLWTKFAEQGSTRNILAHGQVTVLPSPLANLGKSHAERMLALIEAALIKRVPAGLETTNIDGQELSRIPIAELERLRIRYRAEVASEQNAAGLAAGLPNRRTVFTSFRRPR
jgi:hypothetical protein